VWKGEWRVWRWSEGLLQVQVEVQVRMKGRVLRRGWLLLLELRSLG
jgi:hypothetical protein